MNKLLVVAVAIIAVASFSALGMSIVTASNSNQEKIGNVPGVIAYQGYLADGKNLPIKDGKHSLVFTIYNDATSKTSTWTEKQDVVTSDGVFSAMLGSNTPLSEDLFTTSIELHLGISVDGGNEALPRQRLASVPFAIVANKAKTASTASRALDLDCTGCVTSAHLSADAKSAGTTMTSPNGQFQVRVTNSGIFLEGPVSDYELILTGKDLTVGGNAAQLLLRNGDVSVTSDSMSVDVTGNLTLTADETAELAGVIVHLGGSENCLGVARLGDLAIVAPVVGGPGPIVEASVNVSACE